MRDSIHGIPGNPVEARSRTGPAYCMRDDCNGKVEAIVSNGIGAVSGQVYYSCVKCGVIETPQLRAEYNDRMRVGRVIVFCAWCKKEFTPRGAGGEHVQEYCTAKCTNAAHVRRMVDAKKAERMAAKAGRIAKDIERRQAYCRAVRGSA